MARKRNNPEGLLMRILENPEMRASIAQQSFLGFFHIYFGSYIKYELADFQKEMMRIAENESIELAVILAFRGSAKSTIITTAYALWSIFGPHQKKCVVVVSQTEAGAQQHLQNIRMKLENSELLRDDFGPFDPREGTWGVSALTLRDFDAKIFSRSIGQNVRGIISEENRPDLILIDDIEDSRSVRSQAERDITYEWVTGELLPTGADKLRVLAVGNLLHEDSTLKRLQRKIEAGEMSGVYREYPILDKDGKPLWPGRFPAPESVEKLRRRIGNDLMWMREFMLEIIPTPDQLVRRDAIRYYDALPNDIRYYAIGVDPAFGENDQNCFTAMVPAAIVGSGADMKVYVLPRLVNDHLSTLETQKVVKELSRTIGGGALAEIDFEDVGYQRMAIDQLRAEGFPVEGVSTGGNDKRARLAVVAHRIPEGRILFPRQGCELLIEQLVGFGVTKDKDLVDAFTCLVRKAVEKNVTEVNGFMQMVEDDLKKMRKAETASPVVKEPQKPTISIADMQMAIRRGFGGQFL